MHRFAMPVRSYSGFRLLRRGGRHGNEFDSSLWIIEAVDRQTARHPDSSAAHTERGKSIETMSLRSLFVY